MYSYEDRIRAVELYIKLGKRWAMRDQMPVREISGCTGLAHNTVKKHLRSEENEPKYPRRVSASKRDPYAEKLAITVTSWPAWAR